MATDMFRPLINRTMRTLDRSFFQRDFPISAARIIDIRNTARLRKELESSVNHLPVNPLRSDPLSTEAVPRKCLLLNPDIKHNDASTWTEPIRHNVAVGDITLIPYLLHLDYDHWNAKEILSSILPEDLLDEIPVGFSPVGHIAHVNLREQYLPYKELIAKVLIDKNEANGIRTVINKTETLGEENEFRVLEYEVLAGDPDLHVDLIQDGCRYNFDYSKVFWNSRLSTEHERIASKFKKGEAVCDVMAGVGPFVIPAAKNGVFAWANDLNPACYEGLRRSIELNKVRLFVRPFNLDGHAFIPGSAERLLHSQHVIRIPKRPSRTLVDEHAKPYPQYNTLVQPRTFAHYVMNLPSTAMDFLPDFTGLYAGHEELFEPYTSTKLPMVHCYCFGPKQDESGNESRTFAQNQIYERLSSRLQVKVTHETPEIEIADVRDVAPNKRQYCASFRLPAEVAFSRKKGSK